MTGKLQGKVVIITGASSGLGHATAQALAKEGAKLVIAARRKDRLQQLEDQLKMITEVLTVVTDVTKEEQVRNLIAKAQEKFGRIDILINNAGAMLNAPVAKANLSDWKQMLDLNVFALMCATHIAVPIMKAQGSGHIVNVSSVSARSMAPATAAYAATKAAVSAFSEALRRELIPDNIRVTVISPGAAESELRDHIPDADTKATMQKYVGAMRTLKAEDVANAVLYAVTQPPNVGIGEIVIRSIDQVP